MEWIKKVKPRKFEKIESGALRIKRCPECKSSPEIILKSCTYGSEKIKVRCRHCGFEIATAISASCFGCGNTFGTFVLAKNVAKAIFRAARIWNSEVVNL